MTPRTDARAFEARRLERRAERDVWVIIGR